MLVALCGLQTIQGIVVVSGRAFGQIVDEFEITGLVVAVFPFQQCLFGCLITDPVPGQPAHVVIFKGGGQCSLDTAGFPPQVITADAGNGLTVKGGTAELLLVVETKPEGISVWQSEVIKGL